jgi:release factor glutamine methyltransferase
MQTEGAQQTTWTVSRLLSWTQEYLSRRGTESPRLCAEILLADTLGCDRIELYTRYHAVPGDAARDRFRKAVREVADGKPLAYVIGYREFFSLRFEVTSDVLIPRPETEILVERTIHLARDAQHRVRRILDIGTGSGCIAVSLAHHLPNAEVCASDVSKAAIEVARRNARRHNVTDRLDFRIGDLFAPWESVEPFDVIVSNPPYVGLQEADELPANVRDHEPRVALFAGEDGLDVVRRLVSEAAAHLSAGGHVLLETGWNQAAAVRKLLDEAGWSAIVTYRDLSNHERVVHARRGVAQATQVA